MEEPKRYYCGNGEGMFEDDKNGHWIEYSEHKAIVEALSEQLRLADVVKPKGTLCLYEAGDTTSARCIHCGREKWEHKRA
jgi:hypothetical protein